MDIALIFELSNPESYDKVVNELKNMGYRTAWSNSALNIVYNLPRGMVWKKNGSSLQQGVTEIAQAVNIVNSTHPVTLVHCITLNAFPWDGIP